MNIRISYPVSPVYFVSLLAAGLLAVALCPAPAGAQTSARQGQLVDEIVARVNNQIITLSEYNKAMEELPDQVRQDCQGCTPEQIQSELADDKKNMLRDMIDHDLLVDRAKDMDPPINVDTDVIKQLDAVRRQYKLATIDDLQKAVEAQGGDWQEYQKQIRDQLLQQRVIGQEVMGRVDISDDDIKKYYDDHKQEFTLPEEVQLAEIFLNTSGRSPEEIAAIHTKAEDLRNRVLRGEDFGEIAKRYSEAPTAENGGQFAQPFTADKLAPAIEKVVFKMQKGQITDVIEVQTGFDIFKVVDHTQAGLQPLSSVSDQIRYKLATSKAEPAIRDYLAQLREQNYVIVKPGYTDTAAVKTSSVIEEVPPTPDAPQKKKKKLALPKVGGQ
ncbi:MAG TPA: peptidylprolyl isomerase [Candidatus Acidoferrales bacterium]|nr:peptidylprolyl isomerase [Candidatus Acidoferrales bacterium]